jgi:hypothetical protein
MPLSVLAQILKVTISTRFNHETLKMPFQAVFDLIRRDT